jgi:hypothetical protein
MMVLMAYTWELGFETISWARTWMPDWVDEHLGCLAPSNSHQDASASVFWLVAVLFRSRIPHLPNPEALLKPSCWHISHCIFRAIPLHLCTYGQHISNLIHAYYLRLDSNDS